MNRIKAVLLAPFTREVRPWESKTLSTSLVHCFIDFRSRFYAIGSIPVGPFDWRSGFVV